jgi:hypothetical protein
MGHPHWVLSFADVDGPNRAVCQQSEKPDRAGIPKNCTATFSIATDLSLSI